MPLFEDVLSDEVILKERLTQHDTPVFLFNKRKIHPLELRLEVISKENQLYKAAIDLVLNQTSEVLILGPLLRQCGYKDLRQLTSLLGQSGTKLSTVFELQIQEEWKDPFPLSTAESFFKFKLPGDDSPFLRLDKHYQILKSQVEYS